MASTTVSPPRKTTAYDRGAIAPDESTSAIYRLKPYFIFVLAASLYFIPFMRLVMRGSDEGILVMGAVRTYQGQLLGRDFFEVNGPGSFYWLALFFKLFGVSFLASRICLFITSLGTALAMYFLSRRICHRYQLLPSAVLFATYFATFWPEISHHVDSNFFALLAVSAIVLWRESKSSVALVTAGGLAGVTALTIQQKGIFMLLAFVVWIGMQRCKNDRWLQSAAVLMAGFITVIVTTLGYFWMRGALGDLIYANVIWPSRNYGPNFSVPYAFLIGRYFHQWVAPMHGVNWTFAMAAMLFTPFLVVALLPFLLPVLALVHGFRKLSWEVSLYWLVGTALWLSEIHRKDITHLVVGSPLLIILLVYYLQRSRDRLSDWSLQAISITTASLATGILVLALLAHPFKTRAGTIHVNADQPEITALIDHVPPGEYVFVYPYAPLDYFLSNTVNPIRFSTVGFNLRVGSRSIQEEITEDLEKKQVKYVLWDQNFEKGLDAYFPGAAAQRIVMAPYLNSHYSPIWSHDGTVLMQRKSQ